jgi:hypothetical protein
MVLKVWEVCSEVENLEHFQQQLVLTQWEAMTEALSISTGVSEPRNPSPDW